MYYYWSNVLLHKKVWWRKIVRNYPLLQWCLGYYPNILSPIMNVTKKNQHCPIKKHRKLNTGMIGVKSIKIEQILLAKRWTLQKHEIAWNIKQKTFSRWSATTNRGKNRNCITPVPFNGELGLPRFTTLPVLIHRWIRTTQVLIHRWNKTPSVN